MRLLLLTFLSILLTLGGCESTSATGKVAEQDTTTVASDSSAETTVGDVRDSSNETADISDSDDATTLGDLSADAFAKFCTPENKTGTRTVPTTSGSYERFVDTNGFLRRYLIKIPTGYDHKADVPLLLFFHGGGGSADGVSAAQKNEFVKLSDSETFILVFPDGHGNTWRGAHCCGKATFNCPIEDLAFVKALVTTLQTTLKIDSKRIYATGFSNGGMFSHRIGAQLPGIFAAIAPVGGTVGGKQAKDSPLVQIAPTAPISVLMVHGKADKNVTFAGGLSTKGEPERFDISFADSMGLWIDFNKCDQTPIQKLTVPTSKGGVDIRKYSGCTNGVEVAGAAVSGLAHTWPTTSATGGFDGTKAIFDFLKEHSKK